MDYDQAAWDRLGHLVRAARRDKGYKTLKAFGFAAGKSDRQLGTLETGGRVGDGTLAGVAKALDWELDYIYAVLEGRDRPEPESSSNPLRHFSAEDLAEEVRRRLLREEEYGRESAPTKRPASGPVEREEDDEQVSRTRRPRRGASQ